MCILNKFNLQLTQLYGLTTDGTSSMIGKNTGRRQWHIDYRKPLHIAPRTALCQNVEYEARYAKCHFNS